MPICALPCVLEFCKFPPYVIARLFRQLYKAKLTDGALLSIGIYYCSGMDGKDQLDITELLIEAIQNYEFLYDLSHTDYKNSKKKQDAWREIATITSLTVEECMKLWKGLRDRYTREKRLKPSGSEGAESNWAYLEKMSFYNKCTRPRKTHTATVIREESPSLSRSCSRSSGWSGIETILLTQSEEEIPDCTVETMIDISTASSETPRREKDKRKKQSELEEVIKTARQIASSLATKAPPPAPEQNRAFVEYVHSRLLEMPPEEATQKRKKMLKVLEDLD